MEIYAITNHGELKSLANLISPYSICSMTGLVSLNIRRVLVSLRQYTLEGDIYCVLLKCY